MGSYSISDLSDLTGVKTHTLRVWEKRYGLLKPRRTESNIRFYEDQDLHTLQMVLTLYRHGVRISRIAEMTPAEMESESLRLTSARESEETKLLHSLHELDVTAMDTLLENKIRRDGFEQTLLTLILPVLSKLEVMWLSGSIEDAHETCFIELVKRKTNREIDTLPNHCEGPKVIMFLPKGNQKELSHLFMHYFIRKQGLCVTDMGCDVNLDCACSALRKCNAQCVVIVNEDPVHWQFAPFIKDLVNRTSLPIIVSGRAAEDAWGQYQGRVIVIDTIDETLRFVSHLQQNLQDHLAT